MLEPIKTLSNIWRYLTGKDNGAGVVDDLDAIAEQGDPTSAIQVIQLCLDEIPEIRDKSWIVLDKLLNNISQEQLVAIDELMRKESVYISQPVGLINNTWVPTNVLGVLSSCPDGYVREAALRQLAKRFDGSELPFIILRVNDWVPIIHELAVNAVTERAVAEYGEHLAANLYLLRRLWATRRYEINNLRSTIEQILQLPQFADVLIQKLQDPNRYARRYAFETLNMVTQLLSDSSPSIRKEALRWMAHNDCIGWREAMHSALFDRNASVREFARYRLPDVDTRALYVASLCTQASNIEATLRGIAETRAPIEVDCWNWYDTSGDKPILLAKGQY